MTLSSNFSFINEFNCSNQINVFCEKNSLFTQNQSLKHQKYRAWVSQYGLGCISLKISKIKQIKISMTIYNPCNNLTLSSANVIV